MPRAPKAGYSRVKQEAGWEVVYVRAGGTTPTYPLGKFIYGRKRFIPFRTEPISKSEMMSIAKEMK